MSSSSKQNELIPTEVANKVGDAYHSAVLLCFSRIIPAILNAAVDLNLFEIISKAKGSAGMSASQIASELPSEHQHPDLANRLDRMLPAIASYSLLTCSLRTNEDGKRERVYALSPVGEYFVLNKDGGSLGPLSAVIHRGYHDLWKDVKDAIVDTNNNNHFETAYGMPCYRYMETNKELGHIFDQSMAQSGSLAVRKVLDLYKGFEGISTLVDVGGIEHVGGDMFESVPKGDAVMLKNICHNWSDEECVKFLRNCYEALPQHGKVIVMDFIMPEIPNSSNMSKHTCLLDSLMFLVNGGKERTEKEYESLCMSSGFSRFQVACESTALGVMEFYK